MLLVACFIKGIESDYSGHIGETTYEALTEACSSNFYHHIPSRLEIFILDFLNIVFQ